jgi:anaphase-promoting complex subunit 1
MVWSPSAGRRGAARQLLLQPQQQRQHTPGSTPAAAAAAVQNPAAADSGTAAAAGHDLVQFRRHAPCLLPERQHLVSMRVCGPRYWPIQVAAAAGSSSRGGGGWSHLYLQQRICVKKKAGSLPYVDDPSGVKSLLFKAFYSGGSSSMGGSSAAAAAAAGAEDEETGGDDGCQEEQQQQQGAFDIVHLCNTFSADPDIQGFAQVLRAATAAAAAAAQHTSSSSSSKQLRQCAGGLGGSVAVSGSAAAVVPGSTAAAAAAAAFLAFCHGALYECIVQEKTSVLPWYLQLYSLGHRVCAAAAAAAGSSSRGQLQHLSLLGGAGFSWGCSSLSPAVQLQDLLLALGYYNSSVAAAAGLCRAAAVHTCSSTSSRGGSASGHQQQQQEAWQVEALGWLPLLQPGFCDGLWKALQQQWRQAGLLPAVQGLTSSSSSSRNGLDCSSALEAYIATGSIQAAAAAAAAGSAGTAAAAAGRTEVLEQLLGSCLGMLCMPSAVDVQRACKAVLQQQQQGRVAAAAAAAAQHIDVAAWMPALAEQLGPAGLSGAALAAVAAAVARQCGWQ